MNTATKVFGGAGLGLVLSALTAGAAPLAAQMGVTTTAAVLYESYDLDPGLGFRSVSELTVPVNVEFGVGDRWSLALFSGYARVDVEGFQGEDGETDPTVSGPLDAEARLTVEVVPDRLSLLLTGVAPSGDENVALGEVPILGVLASDVIGFSVSNLGAGGAVGGGFVAAVPAGELAFGLAASYRHALGFQPVIGIPGELQPGGELRLRAGIEGAVARRTYLRVAGIYSRRGRDELDGVEQNGIGDRYTGYVSLDQGLGQASLTLYAFDSFRDDPRIEQTAVGTAVLPRGNVFAAGGRLAIGLAPGHVLTPRAELRLSSAASEGSDELRRLGRSGRFGGDYRWQVTPAWALVLQGDGLVGDVRPEGPAVDVNGYRVGLHLEVTR